MTDIPAIKLSENSYMPLLGLGTFKVYCSFVKKFKPYSFI